MNSSEGKTRIGEIDHKHTVDYDLDGEEQTSHELKLTTATILSNGGVDPATHYLVRISGERKEFHDPSTVIELHDEEEFISVFSGPTPVS